MPQNEKSDDLQLIANLIRFLHMREIAFHDGNEGETAR
jgi:hypothetical protein